MRLCANPHVFGAMLIVLLIMGCRNSVEPTTNEDRSYLIEAASEISAGEPVVVIVRGVGDGVVDLIWRDGYATRRYPVEMRNGAGAKTIAETQTAGVATISVGDAVAVINVLAGEPVEPIIPLVAPKTTVAGSNETSMGIVVPFDRFGNLVRSGTPLTFTVRRPDETRAKLPAIIQNGVGWREIGSGRVAGDTAVTAAVGAAAGVGARLREVPNTAVRVALVEMEEVFSADSRTLVPLQTEPLRDRFGNLLSDGTLVEFIVAGQDGTAYLTGIIINGVAQTTLQAPLEPQTMRVTARVGDVESAPLLLEFVQFVEPFVVTLRADVDQNALFVESGTLESGAIVPDGSVGRILLARDGVLVRDFSAETQLGRIHETIYLSELSSGSYTVFLTVGGQMGKAEVVVE